MLQLIQKLILGPPPKALERPKLDTVNLEKPFYDGRGAMTGFALNLTASKER